MEPLKVTGVSLRQKGFNCVIPQYHYTLERKDYMRTGVVVSEVLTADRILALIREQHVEEITASREVMLELAAIYSTYKDVVDPKKKKPEPEPVDDDKEPETPDADNKPVTNP